MRRFTSLLVAVVVALLGTVGCGDDEDTAGYAGQTSSTVVETTTSAEPTTTTTSAATPVLAVEGPWDLVFFSGPEGLGIADLWAERITEEYGVEIRVRDEATSTLPATAILSRLDSNNPELRNLVAEAEIVFVNGNPRGSDATDDLEHCVSVTGPAPVSYTSEDLAPYRAVLAQVYDRVAELRSGAPTAVRAMDFYNPVVSSWQLHGIESDCALGWSAFTEAIHQAAADHDVLVARVAEAFNGPGFDEDPATKDLLGPDGVVTNETGKAIIVDLLHELGYAPLVE